MKKRIMAFILAFLMVCLFLVPQTPSVARDSLLSRYIQTIFNQKNGIDSSEVNCIYQSVSGYIWVGTDSGLYRSKGSDFQSINLWNTDRTDMYTINCITQDKEGRMWIGTDNYGLFYIENGVNYHLQNEYYNGIKTIYDICETEDGSIYVSTKLGLYKVVKDEDDIMSLETFGFDDSTAVEFFDIENKGNYIWAISNNQYIYIFDSEKLAGTIDTSNIITDELTSLSCVDDVMYVGTSGREILRYNTRYGYERMSASVEGINGIMKDQSNRYWVFADSGIGYFDSNDVFSRVNDCEFDGFISDMLQDYEGNYWVASKRMGVLLIARSKFVDFNMSSGMQESMVNTVLNQSGNIYVGSDTGLAIYTEKGDKRTDELSTQLIEMLSDVSVRHICSDINKNIWISTYRKYGVIKVTPSGDITSYGRSNGLPSMAINCTLPLKNGDLCVATDQGIAIITQSDEVITAPIEININECNSISLYQGQDDAIYVGTDGDGLYVLSSDGSTVLNHYVKEDGLNSNVVYSIAEGTEGMWIGTDNGLTFYNESFRAVSNIEYSNSIYSILLKDDMVWLVSSMGVLGTTEEELLGSQGLSGRYYSEGDGLLKQVNQDGCAIIDSKNILYVCCNQGLYTLNLSNIYVNEIPPKMKVMSVDVDGTIYEFDDLNNGLTVPSDASRITINFAVFSYSNRGNMQIQYMLKGFDETPIVITGNDSMEAVYTNLEGGEYEFTINAYNGDGTSCEEEFSFHINKELSFFEKPIARISLIVLICISVIALIFVAFYVRKVLKGKNSALAQLSKEHEEAIKSSSAKNDYLANMSNEIKTPINAMVVKAEELSRILENDEENRQKAQSIHDIGDEIIRKVDDIILLAKIEAGKIDVINAPYSITNLIYDLSEQTAEKLKDRSIKLFVELGQNLTDYVIGDEEKVRHILERLLDNSVKYTKEGSITLSVDGYEYVDKNHHSVVNLAFSVADTGIGIQEDRLENLMEIYNISENSNNPIHSGNGVGLAIAKGYADLLRGEIEIESTYGIGSNFTLNITQTVNNTAESGRVRSKIEGVASKEAADKLWLPEVNCLLVDDDEVSQEVSMKILSQFEMKIDIANSGVSAIDMVMNYDYDVVFMDLSMPIMNGIEAMQEIREIEGDKYTHLPIISMDTNAIEENRDSYLEAGFTDNLVKPLDQRRVAAILKDCLPGDKIKEKANDIEQYIEGSRYGAGLEKMMPYIDVEYALEKIGGNIHVFNKLIVSFYNQHKLAIDEMYEKYGKDARAFKAKIHAIRVNSMSVGAVYLSQEASKMESALNIGNRDYVKDNFEDFAENLLSVLFAMEEYINYMDTVSGMTDEEYHNKQLEEQEEEQLVVEEVATSISLELLEAMKIDAIMGIKSNVIETMEKISKGEYSGDDSEFVAVLSQAVDRFDVEEINELITTYFDLKM